MLRILHLTAEDPGSIPGQGTKISQAVQCSEREKKKKKKCPSICAVLLQFVLGLTVFETLMSTNGVPEL